MTLDWKGNRGTKFRKDRNQAAPGVCAAGLQFLQIKVGKIIHLGYFQPFCHLAQDFNSWEKVSDESRHLEHTSTPQLKEGAGWQSPLKPKRGPPLERGKNSFQKWNDDTITRRWKWGRQKIKNTDVYFYCNIAVLAFLLNCLFSSALAKTTINTIAWLSVTMFQREPGSSNLGRNLGLQLSWCMFSYKES